MIEKINAPISVVTTYNHKKRTVVPAIVKWDGETYKIEHVGFHHMYRRGRTLIHSFSVSSKDTFFKITLNTESLGWKLEEISDGLPG